MRGCVGRGGFLGMDKDSVGVDGSKCCGRALNRKVCGCPTGGVVVLPSRVYGNLMKTKMSLFVAAGGRVGCRSTLRFRCRCVPA